MGFWKTITSVQGIQDKKEAKLIAHKAKEQMEVYHKKLEEQEIMANSRMEVIGKTKLQIVHDTIVPFLGYIELLKQKTKVSEFETLSSINISQNEYVEMKEIGVTAGNILSGALTVGSLGALALAGVPTAVTGIVTMVGTASTGVAISTLSGAAATNATLAFLGGGSLAAGGGGMAAGAALLSSITAGVTGGVTLLAAGLYVSYIGKNSLRKAEEYAYKVTQACIIIQASLDFLSQLIECVNEQVNVLTELHNRVIDRFLYFRPLLSDFDSNDVYQAEVFQTCGLLCKAISEIARAPMLEEDGQISEDAKLIVKKAKQLIEVERVNV
ncbi:MAG: hypothetical protein GX294_00905 [Candidatus Cloacimonetes bacterium]|nr:hypothetical protein [Candidatus Cloacimonadota bacterium]